jgi:hypothetical protein
MKNTHDAMSPMWMKMGKTYLFSNHSLDCETSDTGRYYLAVEINPERKTDPGNLKHL